MAGFERHVVFVFGWRAEQIEERLLCRLVRRLEVVAAGEQQGRHAHAWREVQEVDLRRRAKRDAGSLEDAYLEPRLERSQDDPGVTSCADAIKGELAEVQSVRVAP